MINDALFSSKKDYWETPQWLFDKLDGVFHFNLDVCATADNAKCKYFFTKEDNGLSKKWFGNAWMNPPYGNEIGNWLRKAFASYAADGVTTVCLLPARTDTAWFHNYVYYRANYIRFLKGRLKFGDAKNSAPFPSMIVVYGDTHNIERLTWED